MKLDCLFDQSKNSNSSAVFFDYPLIGSNSRTPSAFCGPVWLPGKYLKHAEISRLLDTEGLVRGRRDSNPRSSP